MLKLCLVLRFSAITIISFQCTMPYFFSLKNACSSFIVLRRVKILKSSLLLQIVSEEKDINAR